MPYKTMLAVLAMVSLSLTACGGETDMTRFEPGVYKGKHDETATVEAAQSRQEPLRERALSAMTDR